MKQHATFDLAYWINEREAMRLRKEQGVTPYSADPHMAKVRYCNIRREHDKVTRWLAENWRLNYHAVWQILLARLINNVPTLEKLLPWMPRIEHPSQVREALKGWRKDGPIFGNAYTVSTNGRAVDKVDYILDEVVGSAFELQWRFANFWETSPKLADAHAELLSINGVGSFLAGQIIADLKNTGDHVLTDASDWWEWSCPGPGSLKGLTEYFGTGITERMYQKHIDVCYNEVHPLTEQVGRLHMQDFQNCLCEFSKYMRVRRGGHVRNRYR